jgi:putative transposase
VRQSLLRQALRPVYRKPYRVTTDSAHTKPVAANVLNRRFGGWQINRAWLADLTYIRTDEGWLYLACILDLGSRRVVGWSMSERMKAQLVGDALTMAYWRRKPPAGLIMHSDRGVQYAADEHRKLIAQYRMVQSMSCKGNCWDNAPMESFFKTLKVEWVDRMRYATRAQARLDLIDWIEGFYNAQRVHSSIEYQSPSSFEKHLHAA